MRPVYPDPGLNFDGAVLGLGMLALVVVLGTIAAGLSFRGAPHRSARRPLRRPSTLRVLLAAGAAAGLPVAALTGMRSPWSRGVAAPRSPSAPPCSAR